MRDEPRGPVVHIQLIKSPLGECREGYRWVIQKIEENTFGIS